jgi:UDPglucose 6-dehydrogenase
MEKLKIGIAGVGVVGGACKYGFEKIGHSVVFHDPKYNTKLENIISSDIIFICVPTPSKLDGSCDLSIVESVIFDLKKLNYAGVIAIKSTVIPGTTENLIKLTGLNLCFVPEFLRERCAISDFVENHDLLAIGSSDQNNIDIILKCHGNYPKAIAILTATEAELLKYYSNVLNATKIIFANSFYEICQPLNANYTKIKDAYIKRNIAPNSYLTVNDSFRGYAGVCLPKDTKAIDKLAKDLNLNIDFFKIIDSENNKYIKTVPNGMRL